MLRGVTKTIALFIDFKGVRQVLPNQAVSVPASRHRNGFRGLHKASSICVDIINRLECLKTAAAKPFGGTMGRRHSKK